jgi:hypothetical protein
MTKEEASQIMRTALMQDCGFSSWTVSTPHLQIAFDIVARIERLACAEIADQWGGHYQANAIAQAIRERNND